VVRGRFTYGGPDIGPVEQLPVPPGTKVVDFRLQGESKALLDRIDALTKSPPGWFESAIVVTRTADAFSGELHPGGEVRVITGTPRRWLSATWSLPAAPLPAGWPAPKWDAVLAAVRGVKPRSFAMYDGQRLWSDPHLPAKDMSVAEALPLYAQQGVLGQVWASGRLLLDSLGRDPWVSIEVKPDPARPKSHCVVLTATHYMGPSGGVAKRESFYLAQELGPCLYRYTSEGPDYLRPRQTFTQTDFSPYDMVMYREPIRLPLRWRTTSSDSGEAEPFSYSQLIHCPGAKVPDTWFTDPAGAWPKEPVATQPGRQ
jgi:hypothetical protein